jgi:hypothetical protein
MDNRRRAIILILALLALAFLAFLFIGEPGKKERSYSRVTVNLQNPWLHDEDVYYYTGSFFAKYDTGANKIQPLSDYLFIKSGIGSVSWSPDAVIFQTTPGASDRDDITTAAAQLGANPKQTHWWKYDFTARKYELLALPGMDSCTSLTQAGQDRIACLAAQSSGTGSLAVKIYDLDTGSVKTVFSTDDGIDDMVSDGQTLYFIVTNLTNNQSLHSISLSSSDDKELFTSKEQLNYYVYGGGQVLVNETPNKNQKTLPEAGTVKATKQKLVLLKDGGKTFEKSFKSLPLSLFSNDSGDVLFSSLDGSVKQIAGDSLKTLYKSARPPLQVGDLLFTAHQKLYLIGADGVLSSSPAIPREGRYPSSFSSGKDNDPSGNSFIDTPGPGKQDVFLFMPGVASSQQQAAVGKFLEKKGFKPSEFNFNWVVDGADFHSPVTPNAVIVK